MKNTALGIDYQKGIKQDFTLSCSGLKGLFVSKSLQELSLHIKATFLEHGHKTDYAKICYCMHIIYNLGVSVESQTGKIHHMHAEWSEKSKMQNYVEGRISAIKINHRKIRQVSTPKC